MRDENGQVTGKLKGYNTDGMGYWQGLTEEGIDFKGMKMVLIGTGGAATAIAVRGALDGIAEIEIFNIKDKFYSRGEEIVDLINKNTNCKATMNDLADHDLLKEKMHAADLFCEDVYKRQGEVCVFQAVDKSFFFTCCHLVCVWKWEEEYQYEEYKVDDSTSIEPVSYTHLWNMLH